jgi:hypothetical protein
MGIKRKLNLELKKSNRPDFNQMMLESNMWFSELLLEDTYDDSDDLNIPAPTDIELEIDEEDSEEEQLRQAQELGGETVDSDDELPEDVSDDDNLIDESSISGIAPVYGSPGDEYQEDSSGKGGILTVEFLKKWEETGEQDMSLLADYDEVFKESCKYIEEKFKMPDIKKYVEVAIPTIAGLATGYAAKKLIMSRAKKDRDYAQLLKKYSDLKTELSDTKDISKAEVEDLKTEMDELKLKIIELTESDSSKLGINILGEVINEENMPSVEDREYGLPEVKKYPMYDAKHVRSAAKLFDHGNLSKDQEDKLAKAIKKQAEKYNVDLSFVTDKNSLYNYLNEDEIPGGKADGMNICDIAKHHGVNKNLIIKQVSKGIEVEYEHTDDPDKAREIAMDHLKEIPDYYDRLEKMEDEALSEGFSKWLKSAGKSLAKKIFPTMPSKPNKVSYKYVPPKKNSLTYHDLFSHTDKSKLDKATEKKLLKSIEDCIDVDSSGPISDYSYFGSADFYILLKYKDGQIVAFDTDFSDELSFIANDEDEFNFFIKVKEEFGAGAGYFDIRESTLNEAKSRDIHPNIPKKSRVKMRYSFKDKNKIKNKIKNISTMLKKISKTKFKEFDEIKVNNDDFEELQDIFNLIPGINEIEFDKDGTLDADDVMKLSLSTRELITVVDEQSFREKDLEKKVKQIKRDIGSSKDISTEFVGMQDELKDMTTVRFRVDTYIGILTDFVEGLLAKINKLKK